MSENMFYCYTYRHLLHLQLAALKQSLGLNTRSLYVSGWPAQCSECIVHMQKNKCKHCTDGSTQTAHAERKQFFFIQPYLFSSSIYTPQLSSWDIADCQRSNIAAIALTGWANIPELHFPSLNIYLCCLNCVHRQHWFVWICRFTLIDYMNIIKPVMTYRKQLLPIVSAYMCAEQGWRWEGSWKSLQHLCETSGAWHLHLSCSLPVCEDYRARPPEPAGSAAFHWAHFGRSAAPRCFLWPLTVPPLTVDILKWHSVYGIKQIQQQRISRFFQWLTFLRYQASASSLFLRAMPSYWTLSSAMMAPRSGPWAASTSTFTCSLARRAFRVLISWKHQSAYLTS